MPNQTQSYSCGCYLVEGNLSNVGLPHRIVLTTSFNKIILCQQSYEANQDCLSYLLPNNIHMNNFEFNLHQFLYLQ